MKTNPNVLKADTGSTGAQPVGHMLPELPQLPHEPVEPRRKEYPEWGDPPFTPHPQPIPPPELPPEVVPHQS